MLPAAPDAAPALKTRTRTSARGLALPALAVVAGWDDAGAAADVGVGTVVGVVAWLVRAEVAPFPAGPLSITCRSTMPSTTARPTSPAPRTAELTPDPPRPLMPPPAGEAIVTGTAATAALPTVAAPPERATATKWSGRRVVLPYGLAVFGCAPAARA